MRIQTRFSPGDRIYFYRDGQYFPALITAMHIEVTRAASQPETIIRYHFNVPPYVLAEHECYNTDASRVGESLPPSG